MKGVLLFLVSFPFLIFSQEKSQLKKIKFDTAFIQSYKSDLTVKLYGTVKTASLSSSKGGILKQNIIYSANRPLGIGIGFSYKGINILATLINPLPSSAYEKGTTKHFGAQLHVYGRRMLTDVWFEKYTGMYLQNTKQLNSKWIEGNSMYKRKDMSISSVGGVIYWNTNKERFSYKAVFSQTERQLKSTGAPIIGLSWSAFALTADSSLIPYFVRENYLTEENIQNLSALTVGSGCGYAYTLVLKKHFFISLTSCFFGNMQTKNYRIQENIAARVQFNLNFSVLGRGAIGYNSNKNYIGLLFVADAIPIGKNNEYNTYKYSFGRINLMYAHRFTL